jgi:hypothetical protein
MEEDAGKFRTGANFGWMNAMTLEGVGSWYIEQLRNNFK